MNHQAANTERTSTGPIEPAGTSIDLDHYTWRIATIDDEGRQRYLIPHSDPQHYEYAIDGIFSSAQDAVTYLDEWGVDSEEAETFVLLHVTAQIVAPPYPPARANHDV